MEVSDDGLPIKQVAGSFCSNEKNTAQMKSFVNFPNSNLT